MKKDLDVSSFREKDIGFLTKVGEAHQSLNDVIVDALRKAIFVGQFKPGDRLPETQLADIFNVSRIPIREALRILSYEGLVEINPRKGARVPSLSFEEISEIIDLRAELEGISARNAARDINADTRENLQNLLDEGNEAAKNNDFGNLISINSKFHSSLAAAGKNRYLAEFARSLRDRTYWLFYARSAERPLESWREHAAILEAVIAQDEQLAAALASRHVRQVGKNIPEELAQKFPNNIEPD